jgi:hypothetical protein
MQNWSGKRDLNPRPSPWQGDALPLSYSRPFRTLERGRILLAHNPTVKQRYSSICLVSGGYATSNGYHIVTSMLIRILLHNILIIINYFIIHRANLRSLVPELLKPGVQSVKPYSLNGHIIFLQQLVTSISQTEMRSTPWFAYCEPEWSIVPTETGRQARLSWSHDLLELVVSESMRQFSQRRGVGDRLIVCRVRSVG